jgi:phosphohistidine phosphatase
MDIYVVRHAIAEEKRSDRDDAERGLTRAGRARFERAVRGMAALGMRFDHVMHSPWKRAVQTATMLAPLCDGPRESTVLLAQAPTPPLLDAIVKRAQEGPTAVVGHQPWLGELVAMLAWGDAALGAGIELRKGGVAWLRAEGGEVRLRELLSPRALRAMR